ncbi:hypothetical protein [Parasphingopyxis sp.]|uniref:hypothetical protein n=1 Tax=Parasphingopyxis sp. TaxID=1920299 RepID=UPI00261F0E1E|nr:hypothetical protein [Parasphingopyxis sp.]
MTDIVTAKKVVFRRDVVDDAREAGGMLVRSVNTIAWIAPGAYFDPDSRRRLRPMCSYCDGLKAELRANAGK